MAEPLNTLSDDALFALRQLMSTWLADPFREDRGEQPTWWLISKKIWVMPGSGRTYGGPVAAQELVDKGWAKIGQSSDQNMTVAVVAEAARTLDLPQFYGLLVMAYQRRREDRAQMVEYRRGFSDGDEPRPKREKKAVEPKEPREQKQTAASLFRDLILEGKLSDDDIFKRVQEAFGLPDSRRSYVDWYRKELIKKGQLKPQAS